MARQISLKAEREDGRLGRNDEAEERMNLVTDVEGPDLVVPEDKEGLAPP